MTETQFFSKLKRWFWSAFLIQAVVVVGGAIYFAGSVQATVGQHTEEIKTIQSDLNDKADVQMVLRIKGDLDSKTQIILDNTREIKASQDKLYDALINHISKEK